MERYRLKNAIIIILAMLNIFLLSSLLVQGVTDRASQRASAAQMSSLFAADGMALEPSLIPAAQPPAPQALSRNEDLERRAAAALLGEEAAPVDEGGGISTYTAASGSVRFRSGGAFDAILTEPRPDGVQLCTDFCRDFSYAAPQFLLDEEGSGAASALGRYRRLTVYNCSLLFTLEKGMLCAVSGTLAPEKHSLSAASQETPAPLSALSALSAFQQARHSSGTVVSQITDISLCWDLQTSSGAPVLQPAWQISTDTANFYVNCISGAVGRG